MLLKTPLLRIFVGFMKLIEVCVKLEDQVEKNGFEFDWTLQKQCQKQ